MTPEFIHFPKIARLSRLAIVTEKIDGTNAQCLKSHQHMSTDSETYFELLTKCLYHNFCVGKPVVRA
jgi:hypothetical protein